MHLTKGYSLVLLSFLAIVCLVTGQLGIDDRADDPVGLERCFVDLVFAIDRSGSVVRDFAEIKAFVKSFVHFLLLGVRGSQVAVVSFGNDAALEISLTQHYSHAAFNASIDNIQHQDGRTNIADAFRVIQHSVFTRAAGDREDFPNVVILISDGMPNLEEHDTVPLATEVKRRAKIFTTAILGREGMDNHTLIAIASEPKKTFYRQIMTVAVLRVILDNLAETVCREVRECSHKDVAFVMDASGSIENFRIMKAFVQKIITNIPLDPSASNRIGLVVFSTTATVHATLGRYTTTRQLLEVIDNIAHIEERTNISGAIRLTSQEVFPDSMLKDDRHALIVLITDGEHNEEVKWTVAEARRAKQRGIRIITVGIGYDCDADLLLAMASGPAPRYTFIERDEAALLASADEEHDSVLSWLCLQTHLYPPESYVINHTTTGCSSELVIILDGYMNGDTQRFFSVRRALADALRPIDVTQRRVSIVTVGADGVVLGIEAGRYSSGAELATRIRGLDFMYGAGIIDWALYLDVYDRLVQRRNVSSDIVIITSSLHNPSTSGLEDLKQHMRQQNRSMPRIYTVALGDAIDPVMLSNLYATKNHEDVYSFHARNTAYFKDFMSSLLQLLCIRSAAPLWECQFDADDVTDDVANDMVLEGYGSRIEYKMCGAKQELWSDVMDFAVRRGSTPSSDTGPRGAFSEPWYIYIEASQKPDDADAVLNIYPPGGDVSGPACLRFMRHMHGHHIGSLQVLVRDHRGHERIAWLTYGEQGDQWLHTDVNLFLDHDDYVAIRAMRAKGYSGDIGCDDVTFRMGPCQPSPDAQQILDDYAV